MSPTFKPNYKLTICILFFVYFSNMANALASATCERCKGGFAPAEKIVNSNGELYHEQCFVCAQCFQQFPEGLFYEVGQLSCLSPSCSLPKNELKGQVFSTWEVNDEMHVEHVGHNLNKIPMYTYLHSSPSVHLIPEATDSCDCLSD